MFATSTISMTAAKVVVAMSSVTVNAASTITDTIASNVTARPVPKVCPKAPPGAVEPTNEIIGYVLWGLFILFLLGVVIGIAAAVAGRVFSMPHASKVGIVSIVVVFIAVIAYLVLPGLLGSMTGKGCL